MVVPILLLGFVLVAAFATACVVVLPARRRARPRPLSGAKGAGRTLAGSYTGEAGRRDYTLYVPAAYQGRPLPLLVLLHGCRQAPEELAASTGMNELAEDGPFLVAYPAQTRRANAYGCWNWFEREHQQRDRGEPSLLTAITRQVMAEYAVDPARVFVAGLSAGGAMAVVLAATHPDLFAAAGVHSGMAYKAGETLWSGLFAMHGGGRDPVRAAEVAFARAGAAARAVPLIVFHGDRDRVARPANADQIAAQWVHLAALAADSGEQNDRGGGALAAPVAVAGCAPDGRTFVRWLYRDDCGATVVEKWIVKGLGHAWSGGRAGASFSDPAGPSASAEMVRFFAEHPMPRAKTIDDGVRRGRSCRRGQS